MFAFAIWDEDRETAWLVRDRLGVKPLVWAQMGRELIFGSTVAAVRAGGGGGGLDAAAVQEFLEYSFISDARCIYEGIRKLPAGGMLEWRRGEVVRQWRYWRPAEPEAGGAEPDFEETVREAERLLLEAVKLRLDADVPVGCLLSGGVDSGLVCWAVAQYNPKLTAFTVAAKGHVADESEAARATAGWLRIPHEVIELSPGSRSLLDDLTAAYGEPFGCSSALGMIEIARAIKPHATVLLTGDGGDDVFLGYRTHEVFWRAQQWARRTPESVLGVAGALARLIPGEAGRRMRNLLGYMREGVGAVYRAFDGLPFYENRGMLGPRLRDLRLSQRSIEASRESAENLLRDFLRQEQDNRFVSEFLTKVDGGAMYHALEARSPFLDQKIWEFAGRLPYGTRLRGGELKAVLRELARRRVHPEVASRRKQGFTIPVEDWLLREWRPEVEDLMAGSRLEREGWLRPGAIREAVEAGDRAGRAPVQLWTLIVLERWLRSAQEGR
jgi:asparagine synthase (glutamine-hydrolysing)